MLLCKTACRILTFSLLYLLKMAANVFINMVRVIRYLRFVEKKTLKYNIDIGVQFLV